MLNRKAKGQFKTADKLNATLVLTIGESELEAGVVNVKAMATRKEIQVPLTEIYTNFSAVYDELTKEEDK